MNGEHFLVVEHIGGERLASVDILDWHPNPERRWVERAAVLSCFTPERIDGTRPVDDVLDTDSWDALILDSEVVQVGGGQQRRLKPCARREALSALGTRDAMAATLQEIPSRPTDPVQVMIERVIAADTIDPTKLDLVDILGLETVRGWFADILDDLPAADAITAARRRKELLAPHELLAGRHFVGRTDEREDLRSYICEVPNKNLLARLRGSVRGLVHLAFSKPPLVIHGPGGVGKSSLVANFITEHEKVDSLVFIDLDFGRPNIDSRRPETLLAEAARQIGAQIPGRLAEGDRVARDIEQTIKHASGDVGLESLQLTERPHAMGLFIRFAQSALPDRHVPFVLDTFEEAMALGETHTDAVLQMTAELQEALPRLRPIVCSRVEPPQSSSWLNIALLDMEVDHAVTFLQRRLDNKGVGDIPEPALRAIAMRIVRTPLALNLAADLLEQAQRDGRDPRSVAAQIRARATEAFLFDRLLEQIEGANSKKLAIPGLIVRRLQPELVFEVLAQPCGLALNDPHDALLLLEQLAKQISVLDRQPGDVFVHRAECRRFMLKDLENLVGRDMVQVIDRAAAAYFGRFDTVEARAEHIYHLLRLGEIEQAEALMTDDAVVGRLSGALDELGAQARLTLSMKLGVTPRTEDLEAADADLWSRGARVRAEELLDRGDYASALVVVREKPQWRNAILDRIEAESLVGLERWNEAQTVAERGLHLAETEADDVLAVSLALTLIRIGFGSNDLELAAATLERGERIVGRAIPLDLRLHLAIARLRLARLVPNGEPRQAAQRTVDLLEGDSLARISGSTLRELAGELQQVHAIDPTVALEILTTALFRLGFEDRTGETVPQLGELIEGLADPDVADGGLLRAAIASTVDAPRLPPTGSSRGTWQAWVDTLSNTDLGRVLAVVAKAAARKGALGLVQGLMAHMSATARKARERVMPSA